MKDFTGQYLAGESDEERDERVQRFSERSTGAQQRRMEQTAILRAGEGDSAADIESLPLGQVFQVYSRFSEVLGVADNQLRLCVIRKTLNKLADSAMVTGDLVRFRETGISDDQGRPEATIEAVLPRKTVLTRADSFKAIEQHPLVANAEQMLIVVSLRQPTVRWGLVDRMIVAARAGGLRAVVCLNKLDLCDESAADRVEAEQILQHYTRLGFACVRSSATCALGLDELRRLLCGHVTVLAGHSGVGKSSLISAIQPGLDLRVEAISGYTGKGRHTTTSARRYPLDGGGAVIDTPGVKLFGLWGVSRENLLEFFPDVDDNTAPPWRIESYRRILDSLPPSGPLR